jgi:hypothetical protein
MTGGNFTIILTWPSVHNDHNQCWHPPKSPCLVWGGFWLHQSGGYHLFDKQLLKNKKTLSEFNNGVIDSICCLICWDSNQPIANVAVTRLKLATIWIKHQDLTLQEVGVTAKPLVLMTLLVINTLKEQKWLEDNWAFDNKEPNYIVIILSMTSAAKALKRVETILTRVGGMSVCFCNREADGLFTTYLGMDCVYLQLH